MRVNVTACLVAAVSAHFNSLLKFSPFFMIFCKYVIKFDHTPKTCLILPLSSDTNTAEQY
jgi:hypothetical protein